jgi:hypothetical protein
VFLLNSTIPAFRVVLVLVLLQVLNDRLMRFPPGGRRRPVHCAWRPFHQGRGGPAAIHQYRPLRVRAGGLDYKQG